jgi:DNA-binding transcriptional LysR family regulator
LEIQQLRHLLAAVKHGNFVKAADACRISQSGLSRSITNLEQRLGVPLLVRSGTGVAPTVFGLSVLHRANLILNEVERSVQEVRAIEEGRAGSVSIGITQNYAHYLIPGIIADFHRTRPDISIQVTTGTFIDLASSVASGDLDFAFGLIGPIDVPAELIIQPLREHYARVVASAAHPLAASAGVSVEELAAARWATLTGEGFQRNFINFFTRRGQPLPAQALMTDSIELIRRTVLATDMLTVLPPNVVLTEIEAGRMVILPCETPAEVTQIGFVFRPSSLIAPPVRMMTDAIWAAMDGHTPSPT